MLFLFGLGVESHDAMVVMLSEDTHGDGDCAHGTVRRVVVVVMTH